MATIGSDNRVVCGAQESQDGDQRAAGRDTAHEHNKRCRGGSADKSGGTEMREDEKSKIDSLANIRTQLSKIAVILCAVFVFAVALAVKSNACTFGDCKQNSALGYNDGRISLIGPPDEAIIKRAVKIIRQCDPTLLRHEQCWMLRRRQACKQAVAAIQANRASTLGVECHRLLVHAKEVVNAK